MNIYKTILISLALCAYSNVFAASSDAELRSEISFLAKKLLDNSGESTLTVEQPSVMKPFLGICGEPGHSGILLNCVTPGHNAYKAGLQTGDTITSINGISMLEQRSHDHQSTYFDMMANMKTGDVLALKLLRHGEIIEQSVTVGVLNQPSYTLIIKRK